MTISNQVEVINRILKFIENEWDTQNVKTTPDQLSEESKMQFLRGIYSKVGYTPEQVEEKAKNHPISGYRVSNLFTGGNDISMDAEIRRDIQTADNIDLIVSFIKFEGVRLLMDDLKKFVCNSAVLCHKYFMSAVESSMPASISRFDCMTVVA